MNKYQEIKHLVENVSKIVITSHKSPDGGKDVVVCHPDPAPDYLHWVPFVDEIQNWEEDKEKVVTLMNEA